MNNIISLHGDTCAAAKPATRSVPELIVAHKSAWDTFQTAPDGEASLDADDAMHEALFSLCCTAVQSELDVMALHRHLTWFVAEEGDEAGDLAIALLAAIEKSAKLQSNAHLYWEARE